MEYIEKTLGLPVIRKPWPNTKKMPYFLTERYEIEQVSSSRNYPKPIGFGDFLFIKVHGFGDKADLAAQNAFFGISPCFFSGDTL